MGAVAEQQRRGKAARQCQDQFDLMHLNDRIPARAMHTSGEDMAIRDDGSAAPFVPPTTSLRTLRAAAHECRGCDLYKRATQVVFGEGPKGATVMFVGEQPGDQEDRQGEPFVGPAGALLDKALAEAGIPRE